MISPARGVLCFLQRGPLPRTSRGKTWSGALYSIAHGDWRLLCASRALSHSGGGGMKRQQCSAPGPSHAHLNVRRRGPGAPFLACGGGFAVLHPNRGAAQALQMAACALKWVAKCLGVGGGPQNACTGTNLLEHR